MEFCKENCIESETTDEEKKKKITKKKQLCSKTPQQLNKKKRIRINLRLNESYGPKDEEF